MIGVRNIIIDRETAERLKDLGAPQSALWYWVCPVNPEYNARSVAFYPLEVMETLLAGNDRDEYDLEAFAAYTLDEIGLLIDRPFHSGTDLAGGYARLVTHTGFVRKIFRTGSELEARASLLVYLLEVAAGKRAEQDDPKMFYINPMSA